MLAGSRPAESGGFIIPKLCLIGEGSDDRELGFNAENVRRDDARYTP